MTFPNCICKGDIFYLRGLVGVINVELMLLCEDMRVQGNEETSNQVPKETSSRRMKYLTSGEVHEVDYTVYC